MSFNESSRPAVLILLAAFILAGLFTSPEYIGDTTRYAADALRHEAGESGQFWEFGHLLWRPWGWVGLKVAGTAFGGIFGDTPEQATIRFLMVTAWLCASAALVLMYLILRAVAPAWAALAGALGLLFTNPFLNYSRAGAPYVPALCFLLLAVWLLIGATKSRGGGVAKAAMAGASFALSFSLWFPFSLAGAGALAIVLLGPATKQQRWRVASVFCATACISGAAVFGAGACAHGITNTAEVAAWVRESKNDWQQSIRVARLATGLPRSVYELAADGMLLKRRLFHDPYNPVATAALVPVVLKTAWFFLTAAVAGLALLVRKESRTILAVAVCGTAPLVLFSVFLFEPGSPERFLPAFPFVFMACAGVLGGWRQNRVSALAVAALFSTAAVLNVWALNGRAMRARKGAVLARKAMLERNTGTKSAVVYVATLRDDLYRMPGVRPLDHDLLMPRLDVRDLVEIASVSLPSWRARFAGCALSEWEAGGEVWISERLFARRPEAGWEWVEGDDKRVRWADFAEFFTGFETGERPGGPGDGFLKLLPTAANRQRLEAQVPCTGGTQ